MKRFLSRLFLNDYVYCSIFVAMMLGLISTIPINHELTDPFKEALGDFEVTDLAFTELRAQEPAADTNIVIVNTGRMERAELAAAVRNLNEYSPAVIGFNDILYRSEDDFGDSLLAEVLKEVDHIVYTSKLSNFNDSTGVWEGVEVSDSLFMKFEDTLGVKYAETGFKNMFTHDKDFKTTRHFYERANIIGGARENFFPVELIEAIAPEKVEQFMKRSKEYEVINYRGNIDKFTTLDAEQVLNGEFDPTLIKGKILILGYLGESLAEEKFWDDYKYYTPLNKKYAGKTFPDMFETVIYANIASQILADNHLAAHFDPRHDRQHPVQQHDVGHCLGDAGQRLLAVDGLLDAETLFFQVVAQHGRQRRLVLHDQHDGFGRAGGGGQHQMRSASSGSRTTA